MRTSKQRIAALLAMVMLTSGLSGCALLHFDDPAEIKAQEEELAKQQNVELPDVQALLDPEHLVMDAVLKDASGKEIARYQACFPYFEAGDNAALQNINQYYEGEFGHLSGDKDRFFQLAQEKPTQSVHSSSFDYELLKGEASRVAVLRSFESIDSLGESGKLYTCELFSAATGLRLKFTDIFSSDSKGAVKTLRAELADWCADKAYDTAWLDGLTDELLCENFTLDADTLYIGFDKNTLPGGETLVELDLETFMPYMGSK